MEIHQILWIQETSIWVESGDNENTWAIVDFWKAVSGFLHDRNPSHGSMGNVAPFSKSFIGEGCFFYVC